MQDATNNTSFQVSKKCTMLFSSGCHTFPACLAVCGWKNKLATACCMPSLQKKTQTFTYIKIIKYTAPRSFKQILLVLSFTKFIERLLSKRHKQLSSKTYSTLAKSRLFCEVYSNTSQFFPAFQQGFELFHFLIHCFCAICLLFHKDTKICWSKCFFIRKFLPGEHMVILQ